MSSPIPPELQQKIASARLRAISGELTLPEMREMISLLREGRVSAVSESDSARRRKAIVAVPSAADMLAALKS